MTLEEKIFDTCFCFKFSINEQKTCPKKKCNVLIITAARVIFGCRAINAFSRYRK